MAEIGKRRRGELIQGVLQVLSANPDGIQASDALQAVAHVVPPTEYELGTYGKGARRFEKIVRFTTIGPVKAGWMTKSKGLWAITTEGVGALAAYPDPEVLVTQSTKLYNAWKKAQPVEDSASEDATDDEAVESSTALEEAEEAAWADIRAYLAAINPYDFQEIVADLLRAMDYYVDWVAPPGADGGVDVIAYADALGTAGPRVKVQVKRRTSKSGPDEIRAFLAVLGDQDSGLFVSTGGFTAEAQREARAQEKRRLVLVDDTRLVELWIEHYERLEDSARQRLPLRPIYFLSRNE